MPRTTPRPGDLLPDIVAAYQRLIKAGTQKVTQTHRDTTQYLTDPNTGLTGNVTSSASGNSATLPDTSVVMHHGQIPADYVNGRFLWDDALQAPRPLHGTEFHDTSNGNVRLHVGTQPETDSSGNQTHGMWVHDHQGNPRLKVGGQNDGTTGQWSLDGNGNVVLKSGQIQVGSSTYYGLAAYDTSNDLLILLDKNGLAAYDSNGDRLILLNANGLTAYDANANPLLYLGKQSDGNYALVAKDTTGQERVRMGHLDDGTYGLSVTSADGSSTQDIFPVAVGEDTGSISGTNSAYSGSPSDSPSKSVQIGPSGRALITAQATETNSADEPPHVGIFCDGSLVSEFTAYSGQTTSGSGLATGLSQGSHTFELQYKAQTSGATYTLDNRIMVVQPL